MEAAPWPPHSLNHRAPGISFHNGRVYIDYRRELMVRYAAKWMGSLHDRDRSAYAGMICQELAEDSTFDGGSESGEREIAEKHLRSIIKLGQTSVIFTVFEDLFKNWLDLLPNDHRQVCNFDSPSSRYLIDKLVLPAAHPPVQQRRGGGRPWKRNPRQFWPHLHGHRASCSYRSLENYVPSCLREQGRPHNWPTLVLYIRTLRS